MTDNQKKIHELPLGNQIFLYSYFALLIITLGGFVSAAISSRLLILICTLLLIITLIINIASAFTR